jgi:hypothetical protein
VKGADVLYQIRTWGVTLTGVLIVGVVVGSLLADTSALWWLIIMLGIVAFGGGIILAIVDRGRSTTKKPLTRV